MPVYATQLERGPWHRVALTAARIQHVPPLYILTSHECSGCKLFNFELDTVYMSPLAALYIQLSDLSHNIVVSVYPSASQCLTSNTSSD